MRLIFALCLLCCSQVYAEENPAIACTQQLTIEPKFSPIANKLPLGDMRDIDFQKLTIKAKPTKKESKIISSWVDARNNCFNIGLEYAKKNYHPQLVSLAIEANNREMAVAANLFNRDISYGEANKQIQSISDDYRNKILALVEQVKAEKAAQQLAQDQANKAQADKEAAQRERDRQYAEQQQEQENARQAQIDAQKRQLGMQILQQYQQNQQNNYNQQMQQIRQNQQIYQNRMPVTTNCNGTGNNSMTCTSQ